MLCVCVTDEGFIHSAVTGPVIITAHDFYTNSLACGKQHRERDPRGVK